jgi:hypothetical protein
MNKTKLVLVGAIVAALCFASFVYALTTLSWTQNPQVPTGSFIAKYGTTVITQDSNQTDIWTWNGATSSFNTTITIQNDGTSTINVKLDYSGLNPLWTPNGFGTQASIPIGGTRLANLSIVKPSALSGEYVGQFTITMTIVP